MAGGDRPIWKKLRAFNVPPKVRNFVWRACSSILPTRDNLSKKKLNVDPCCVIFYQQFEMTGHLLWECPLARNFWVLFSNHAQYFFLLFKQMIEKLDLKDLK